MQPSYIILWFLSDVLIWSDSDLNYNLGCSGTWEKRWKVNWELSWDKTELAHVFFVCKFIEKFINIWRNGGHFALVITHILSLSLFFFYEGEKPLRIVSTLHFAGFQPFEDNYPLLSSDSHWYLADRSWWTAFSRQFFISSLVLYVVYLGTCIYGYISSIFEMVELIVQLIVLCTVMQFGSNDPFCNTNKIMIPHDKNTIWM